MSDTGFDPVISLSCTTEYPSYEADKNENCWGLVTLKAPYYEPEESKRPLLDIVAVIDKSGSMKGEKLFLVKKSLEFLVANLLEKDRLCVITYDSNVYVNFQLLPMKSENKEFAKQKIREIVAGTSTNLCGGLLQGLCEVLDREKKNDVASVLVFTDGLANQGITETSQIIKAMENPKHYINAPRGAAPLVQYQRNSTQQLQCSNIAPDHFQLPQQQQQEVQVPTVEQQPIQQSGKTSSFNKFLNYFFHPKPTQESEPTNYQNELPEEKVKIDIDASVYTFGFGYDHDPILLKSISDAGDGMYFYIANEEQIPESFGHCFGGLVSTLGQNIKLKMELCDGVTIDTIHTHQKFWSDSSSTWQVNVGDIQSEEQRDILLTLNLSPVPNSPNPIIILKSSLKYFSVIDSKYKTCEGEMVVMRSDGVQHSPEAVNKSVDRQRNRILTTKAVKEALQLADKGDIHSARNRLKVEITRVKASLTGEDEFCKLLVKDMQQSLSGLKDRHSYVSRGKRTQLNMLQMHSKQRSNRADENAYTSVSNTVFQAKFSDNIK